MLGKTNFSIKMVGGIFEGYHSGKNISYGWSSKQSLSLSKLPPPPPPPQPHCGHLNHVKRIYGYLYKLKDAKI